MEIIYTIKWRLSDKCVNYTQSAHSCALPFYSLSGSNPCKTEGGPASSCRLFIVAFSL